MTTVDIRSTITEHHAEKVVTQREIEQGNFDALGYARKHLVERVLRSAADGIVIEETHEPVARRITLRVSVLLMSPAKLDELLLAAYERGKADGAPTSELYK